MRWIQARDPAGRVLAIPNQTPGITQRYGLTRSQVDHAAWVIEPDGRRFAGAAAINRIFKELGGVWIWVGQADRLPLIHWLENRIYRWVERHRQWLSSLWGTTPACEEPGVECV